MMQRSALQSLMGGYYHEDFDTQGGVWGTLELFLEEATVARAHELVADIDGALAQHSAEPELAVVLQSFGCKVYMGDEPGGYRAWLEGIAVRVRRYLAER